MEDPDAIPAQANPFKHDAKRRKTVNKPSSLPLPSDKMAEMGALGTLICEPNLFYECCGYLRADDFGFEPHRRIYRAFLALFGENEPVDILTLVQQLQATGELAAVGGVSYISDLVMNDLASAPHLQLQIERLTDLRKKREVILVCNEVEATAHEYDTNSAECIDKLNLEAMTLAADHGEKKAVKLADLIAPTLAEWRERAKITSERAAVGLTFGLPLLDKNTTGMWAQEVTLLGGHTKDAKTSTAIQVVVANLRENIPVFYASHEMNRQQVYARIMAQVADVPFTHLRDSRQMTARDWAAVEAANSYIQRWPLLIDDSPSMDISKLIALGRLHARRDGCKLMVVDYLQRVHGPGERKHEVVSNVSRLLCGLAKQEKIHVLALSQLTNPMDRERQKVVPNLRMFRDSGDPVQDAHLVLAVWRPEKEGKFTGQDQILILAQRSGAGNLAINVEFDSNRLCFAEKTAKKESNSQKGIDYDDDGPNYAA